MVKETTINKDAVLKLGERKPFIMPILLFVVPTIVSTLIYSAGNRGHRAVSVLYRHKPVSLWHRHGDRLADCLTEESSPPNVAPNSMLGRRYSYW